MRIGLIGLGRMGMNMARRLLINGQEVVAYNRTASKTDEIVKEGATGAYSLKELVDALPTPKIVWVMLPAGRPIDDHLAELLDLMSPGDIIVDGANSYYKDSMRRGERLGRSGLVYMDVGVSGGIWGLKIGYCLMIGGEKTAYDRLTPVFQALAPPDGFLHCGSMGSGHYVKMIHNGIEYGMMQSIGEGFALIEASRFGPDLNLAKVAHLWNQGSVVRSWLMELAEAAFCKDPSLESLRAYVQDSGEGRWTIQEAIEMAVPAPVLSISLMERFRSRQANSFVDRVLAALRHEFGGHAVKTTSEE